MKDCLRLGKQDIHGTKHGFRAVDDPFSTPGYIRLAERCRVENRKKHRLFFAYHILSFVYGLAERTVLFFRGGCSCIWIFVLQTGQ